MQGWFNIVNIGSSANVITLIGITNLVSILYYSGSIYLKTYDVATSTTYATTSLATSMTTGSWYYLSTVHTSSKTWTTYVNGVKLSTVISDPN